MAAVKTDTDIIIIGIATSPIGRVVILVIMYVKTFRTSCDSSDNVCQDLHN